MVHHVHKEHIAIVITKNSNPPLKKKYKLFVWFIKRLFYTHKEPHKELVCSLFAKLDTLVKLTAQTFHNNQ